MISKDEIKKLADLARIGIEDGEAEELAGEIDSILGYVKSIEGFHSDEDTSELGQDNKIKLGLVSNVFREDIDPNETGAYTDVLLKEMPVTEKGFLKVKKILQ